MIKQDSIWPLIGGIEPPQNKKQSSEAPIRNVPEPEIVIVPLTQASGVRASPTVAVGDHVRRGQIMATWPTSMATKVLAPVSGTVTAIEPRVVAHPSGLTAECIVVKSDRLNDELHYPAITDWQTTDSLNLIQRINDCGISGMGGAGFPTHIKYQGREKVHTLIVNGVECEPYITADDRLMQEHADQVITGIRIALKILGANKALIAIEDNKPEAIAAMETAADDCGDHRLEIKKIPTKYPSGGEKQLIHILTGREVPVGRIPASLGLLVQNTGTLFAIAQAVTEGRPLTERVMTLTGDSIHRKGNYRVRIGTPVIDLIRDLDEDTNADRVIMGGPMMGFELPDTCVPITRETNCLIIPAKNELPPGPDPMACIRCGQCEQVCPQRLLPQQLFWNASNHDWEKAELNSIFDCIECGACAWVCPSHIPLVQYYRFAKAEIKHEHREAMRSAQSKHRFENRQRRLEIEAEEKEAKRKARSAAAAKQQAAKSNNTENVLGDQAKADIQAAIERAKAKKAANAAKTPDAPKSAEELEAAWKVATTKIDKAKEKLAAAKNDSPHLVPALEKALTKLEEKAEAAHRGWQEASKNSDQNQTEGNH